MLDQRGQLLRAAVGFSTCSMPSSGLTHRRTLDTGDAFKTQPACEAHASRQEKQFGGEQGDVRKRGCQEPRLRAESTDSVTQRRGA